MIPQGIVDTTKFYVFNKATCFELLGHFQANTCSIKHKREIQKS
jgi:hypothetical protein